MILADIVRQEYFSEIANKYKSGIINDNFLEGFRNILSRREIDLGIAFENIIESFTGYRFNDKMSRKELEKLTEFYKSERQREFDVLFDNSAIEKQMSIIFEFKERVELTYAEMEDFYKDFLKSKDLRQNVTTNTKHLLMEILRNDIGKNQSLNVADVYFYIEKKELDIMVDILNSLHNDRNQNVIKSLCLKNTPAMINAYQNNVLGDGVWLPEDYLMFETIFKFQRFFKFHLNEELLLNMIWFHQYTDDMDFEFLNEIVSGEKIKERVIENVNASVDENNAYFYIKYLVENEINLSV